MWTATTDGFYSVVANRNDSTMVLVRARDRKDLERLSEKVNQKKKVGPIVDSPNADYPYRIHMPKKAWADYIASAASDIDYPNFKSRIGKDDRERADVYHDVWAALMKLERRNGDKSRWHLPTLDIDTPANDADWFDENDPYQCQFCEETLVGWYDACPWCGEELWDWDVDDEEE